MFQIKNDIEKEKQITEACQLVLAAVQQEISFLKDLELSFSLNRELIGTGEFIRLTSERLPSNLFGIYELGVVSAHLVVEGFLSYDKEKEASFSCSLSYKKRDGGWHSLRIANKGQTFFEVIYNQQIGDIRIISTNTLIRNALLVMETPFKFGQNSEEDLNLLTHIREYFRKPTLSNIHMKELIPLLEELIKKVFDYIAIEELDSSDSKEINEALFGLQFSKNEFEELLVDNK
ncbi:hypothetical protein CN918_31390 [Priestia megaterium]|nr:hypothetical protein CN918_31390 [Priestia megaterium]